MLSNIPTAPAKDQGDSFYGISDVQSFVHVSPEDSDFAVDTFVSLRLAPEKTIAFFAGGESEIQDYAGFGTALSMVFQNSGFKVIALGSPREQAINRRNLADLGVTGTDLTGKTTLRQAAEIVRRCRLTVGMESVLSRIAIAVGVPNVILLGGGNFGRTLPLSPLTTAVCLPLDCFGCGWQCRFQQPHCVRDVYPSIIAIAIRNAFNRGLGEGPCVVVQDRSLWQAAAGKPDWAWFHGLLARQSVKLITGGRKGADLVFTTIIHPRRHMWGVPAAQANARRLAAARECLQASPANLPAVFASHARALVQDQSTAELPASPDEWLFLDEIRSGLSRGDNDPHAIHYRAVAMLYFRAHEIELFDPARIPQWLVGDFIAWSILGPGLFYEIGEKETWLRRTQAFLIFMRAQVESAQNPAMRQQLAEVTSARLNLIPAYFADENVRPLYEARAALTAEWLAGARLDFMPPPRTGGRIRVGILKNHWAPSTETYATLPFYRHLPREKFEVVLFASGVSGTAAENVCKERADRFVVLPQPLGEQAEAIRREQCDFLFFAVNMTAVPHPLALLGAFRMARVQAASICCPLTTGMPHMDVFLAGDLTEKGADAQGEYREKLIRLPGSGVCFDYSLRPPPSDFTVSRAQLGIAESATIFTSGSNFFKIVPELRRVWARVLAASPGSVLVMYPFGPAWTDSYPSGAFIRCFHEELRAAGVDPARLIFLNPMASTSDVQKVMVITDIYLDSFPYTGATSLLDPLGAGVPPVTMAGTRLRFAQGDAMLHELGMPEQVATSEEHYIRIASELARDRALLGARREKVREKMAARPAFLDSERYCAAVADVIEHLVGTAP